MKHVGRLSFSALALCVALLPAHQASGQDLLPPDRPIEEAIDHYVDARLQEKGVTPAPPVSDANFVRRVTLDLTGRIPTAVEVKAYVESDDPQKKQNLVDQLMQTEGFRRHQVDELDALLLYPARNSLRGYLESAVKENRPWDQIFRELILLDDKSPEGSAEFLKAFVGETDQLTNEVTVRFFGINVSCAKCHDHPLVPAWTQHHFYGMKSFFNRTFDNGGFIGEREYGLVDFQTTDGEKRDAKLMFFTGEPLDEPEQKELSDKEKKDEKQRLDEYRKKKQPPPPPAYSRRHRLVEVGLAPGGREYFARNIVNRLWYRLHGYGLVMPLDQMHDENSPSHAEMLNWLARDLMNHNYDLQRLIRHMVLSKTYARDSQWPSEERPRMSLFAVAQLRPLTPHQLGSSLRVAVADPQSFSAEMKTEELLERADQAANSGRGYANNFEMPRPDFEISVDEALFFSNNDRAWRGLLTGGLVNRLKDVQDDGQLIDMAYQNVLLRNAEDDERKTLLEYLAARKDRREEACRQIVWSMLTSTEFRFNY